MLLLINTGVFLLVVLAVILGYSLFSKHRRGVSERLAEIKKIKGDDEVMDEEDSLSRPFNERMVKPFLQNIGQTLTNLTPGEIRSNIEKKIIYAGKQQSMTFPRFITIQVLLAVFLFALFMFVLSLLPTLPIGSALILSLLMGLIGFMFPILSLSSTARKRQVVIQKSLPDFLDLLLVSVDAGLGFDMALKRVTSQMEGPLAQETARALEEMRIGRSREEALRGIVHRTGVPDLSTFISAIIQAEQLGTNIANTLRIQANTMRQKRRQRAEKAAMQAPIKMIFPMAFFIFPVMFVVILGPIMLQIIRVVFTM